MGAALHGGRWNPKGVEVVYAAATVSLAALEVLVQFSALPRDFVLTEIHIPAGGVIEAVYEQDLPTDWQAFSPSPGTQEIGRRWVVELRSAVLSVPSTIVPVERNYVLNPRHPNFGQIVFLPSTPFRFDPRLK
jgi:RES domain-containing protein